MVYNHKYQFPYVKRDIFSQITSLASVPYTINDSGKYTLESFTYPIVSGSFQEFNRVNK